MNNHNCIVCGVEELLDYPLECILCEKIVCIRCLSDGDLIVCSTCAIAQGAHQDTLDAYNTEIVKNVKVNKTKENDIADDKIIAENELTGARSKSAMKKEKKLRRLRNQKIYRERERTDKEKDPNSTAYILDCPCGSKKLRKRNTHNIVEKYYCLSSSCKKEICSKCYRYCVNCGETCPTCKHQAQPGFFKSCEICRIICCTDCRNQRFDTLALTDVCFHHKFPCNHIVNRLNQIRLNTPDAYIGKDNQDISSDTATKSIIVVRVGSTNHGLTNSIGCKGILYRTPSYQCQYTYDVLTDINTTKDSEGIRCNNYVCDESIQAMNMGTSDEALTRSTRVCHEHIFQCYLCDRDSPMTKMKILKLYDRKSTGEEYGLCERCHPTLKEFLQQSIVLRKSMNMSLNDFKTLMKLILANL